MTQGINGYGNPYDRYTGYQPPEESSTSKAARDYCAHADSVMSGFLCGEESVVSNACRTSNSPVDQTLCDDKQLHAAQTTVWDATKSALKTIFGAIVGRAGT